MALFNCPECGKEISDQAAFCPNCGTPFNKQNFKYCQHCGEQIDKECVVCPKCGKQVADLSTGTADSPIIINNNNTSSSSAASSSSGSYGVPMNNMVSSRSRLITLLFCIFLGWIGVHRFYAGKIGTGILMIVLMCTGIGEIWLAIDFILILLGAFTDVQGLRIVNW